MEHLTALENAKVRVWNRIALCFAVLSILGGIGLAVLLVLQVAGREHGSVLAWAAMASILLSFVTSRIVNRAERLLDDASRAAESID